jgi:hypothetical protein
VRVAPGECFGLELAQGHDDVAGRRFRIRKAMFSTRVLEEGSDSSWEVRELRANCVVHDASVSIKRSHRCWRRFPKDSDEWVGVRNWKEFELKRLLMAVELQQKKFGRVLKTRVVVEKENRDASGARRNGGDTLPHFPSDLSP